MYLWVYLRLVSPRVFFFCVSFGGLSRILQYSPLKTRLLPPGDPPQAPPRAVQNHVAVICAASAPKGGPDRVIVRICSHLEQIR